MIRRPSPRYKIEHDVPAPTRGIERLKYKTLYRTLARMKEGDSIVVPSLNEVSAAYSYSKKIHDRPTRSASIGKGKFRVWL